MQTAQFISVQTGMGSPCIEQWGIRLVFVGVTQRGSVGCGLRDWTGNHSWCVYLEGLLWTGPGYGIHR